MRLTDQRVIAFLAKADEPISQEEMARQLGCHINTVHRSIKRLKGIVTPIGASGRRAYHYSINVDKLPDSLKAEIAHHP